MNLPSTTTPSPAEVASASSGSRFQPSTFVSDVVAHPYVAAAFIFVITRIVALLGAYSGINSLLAAEPARTKGWWVELGLMWDSAWYAKIALNGYIYEPGGLGNTNVAFAPLFPFLTRLIASGFYWITAGWDFGSAQYGAVVAAGLLISNVAFYFALVLLIRLLAPRLGKAGASLVALVLAALPEAFFFSAMYTEGLFLLLAVSCVYIAHSNWKLKWLCAGLIGMLASLDRFTGMLLFPVLLVEYMSQAGWRWRKIRPDVLWTLLVPVGIGIYLGFLWWRFGSPFVLTQTMRAGWNHRSSFFLTTYWDSLTQLWQSATGAFPAESDPVLRYGNGSRLYLVLDLAIPLLLVVGGIIGRKRLLASEWAWLVLGIVYPLSTNITFSMARYALPLWPGLIWMGMGGKRQHVAVAGWIIISLGLLAWCSSIYGSARWIG